MKYALHILNADNTLLPTHHTCVRTLGVFAHCKCYAPLLASEKGLKGEFRHFGLPSHTIRWLSEKFWCLLLLVIVFFYSNDMIYFIITNHFVNTFYLAANVCIPKSLSHSLLMNSNTSSKESHLHAHSFTKCSLHFALIQITFVISCIAIILSGSSSTM